MSASSTSNSLSPQHTPTAIDGGLATALESLGADLSDSLWSARLLDTNPSLIQEVHRKYFEAGARIAITASYQASLRGLTDAGYSREESLRLISRSARLAQKARDEYLAAQKSASGLLNNEDGRGNGALLVAGSIGPYGAYLADGSEYRGDYTVSTNELQDFHRERMDCLIGSGVDLLAIETIPSFSEIKALVQLMEKEFKHTLYWVSMTLQQSQGSIDGRENIRIADGTPLAEVTRWLDENGCDRLVAVGVNCVQPHLVTDALKVIKPLLSSSHKIIVYPNSGEGWDAQSRSWTGSGLKVDSSSSDSGASLRTMVQEWIDEGASIIGGCCRMGFEEIRVIDEML